VSECDCETSNIRRSLSTGGGGGLLRHGIKMVNISSVLIKFHDMNTKGEGEGGNSRCIFNYS
jgi:hypothetical protein